MYALLLDVENLINKSFVAEAYRTAERAHGTPPLVCIAFGSPLHIKRTRDVAERLGIGLVSTKFGQKNSADYEMAKTAKKLATSAVNTIIVGSGDRGFLKWLREDRKNGLRLECIARDHQICKEAEASYDALYRMDSKAMKLPSPADLRTAVIDCIPEIRTGPIKIEDATGMLRGFRIAPRHTPGHVFFARHGGVFRLLSEDRYVELV